MENTQENIGKKGSIIKFNNNVIGNDDTKIVVKSFLDKNTKQGIGIFVLRYNFDNIPYEVVLGKLQLEEGERGFKEKAGIVKDFLEKQLEKNKAERNNVDFCKDLDNICVKKDIKFIYTKEGIQIVTNSIKNPTRPETRVLERTYYCDEENGALRLMCLNPDKQMDESLSKVNIRKAIDENRKKNRAIDLAQKSLDDKSMKRMYYGMGLMEEQNETCEDVIFQGKRALVKYLIHYKLLENEHNDKENDKQSEAIAIRYAFYKSLLAKKISREKDKREVRVDRNTVHNFEPKEKSIEERFFRVKEKGIAIDIKKMIEDEQNVSMKEAINMGEVSEENDNETRMLWYGKLFDLIKEGQDINAQFVYKRLGPNGFDELKTLMKHQIQMGKVDDAKALEIKCYIKMKEAILREAKLKNGNNLFDIYDQDDKVKKLIIFTMITKSRDETMKVEKELLSEIYKEMLDVTVLNHKDDVKLYNGYARETHAPICEIPDEDRKMELLGEIYSDERSEEVK